MSSRVITTTLIGDSAQHVISPGPIKVNGIVGYFAGSGVQTYLLIQDTSSGSTTVVALADDNNFGVEMYGAELGGLQVGLSTSPTIFSEPSPCGSCYLTAFVA